MRVLLLTKYSRLGASSRLRSYQYCAYLEENGVTIEAASLFGDEYLQEKYAGSLPVKKLMHAYVERLLLLLKGASYDVLWVEKEVFPWVPYCFERLIFRKKARLILDYDDAIFHRYDCHSSLIIRAVLGKKISQLVSLADAVVTGSEYLASWAAEAGAQRLVKLPTVIDMARYPKARCDHHPGAVIIGWIGTPVTAAYLLPLVPVFIELQQNRGVRVVAVGASEIPEFEGVIEVLSWTEDEEAKLLSQIDIGIMPLPDRPFERGKCAYKIIQYMGSGKPVVASPIGENVNVVEQGKNGFLAETVDEWRSLLECLCDDARLREQLGGAGRAKVERDYSLSAAAPKLLKLLEEVCQ